MAKRLFLRDGENLSADMVQRILGGLFSALPTAAGTGTGYAAGTVGKIASASTGHLAVTADSVDRTLTILPGWASIIRDAGGSSFDPRILFAESDANDSSVTLTANATGSTRNDTVCMKVDQATAPSADGSNLVSFVGIVGASGGGLTNAPADGNLYLPLANVAVANGATLLTQANVTDKRQLLEPYSGRPLATGSAPTLGGLKGGISTQTLTSGTDIGGRITLVTTGAPPGAGVNVCDVTFAVPYPNVPVVVAGIQTGGGGTLVFGVFFVTATGFSIFTHAALGAATSYTIGFQALGI